MPRHSPSALDHRHSEHFRPTSETAEKRRYTPPATRRRGAEGAGRALVHVLTGPVSCGNTTCMLLIVNTQNGCECSTALPQPGIVPLVLLPATAAPRRLKPTPGRLARLLETSWWRGLDRFDRVFEAERFAMSSEPRCAACPVTVRQHSITGTQSTFGRPQKPPRNGATRRQQPAVAALRALGEPWYTS